MIIAAIVPMIQKVVVARKASKLPMMMYPRINIYIYMNKN
jgi:hypothetical protein